MSHKLTAIQLGQTDYDEAFALQKELGARVSASSERFLILVNHPPVVTIGRGGTDRHIVASSESLEKRGIAVHEVDRGGDVTFHGPGQIVGYPIIDLRERRRDIHRYLRDLESVIIKTARRFSVRAGRAKGLTGVWVGKEKLAAIGVAVRRWVTYHGFALNVNTDLDYFGVIVPCGITDRSVTSMAELLGSRVDEQEVRDVLVEEFAAKFDFDEIIEVKPGSIEELRAAIDVRQRHADG